MKIVYIRREKQATKQNEIKEESSFHPYPQTTPNNGFMLTILIFLLSYY